MTETANFYEKLTGSENLMFFGRLHGLSKGEIEDRIKYVMDLFDIYQAKDKKLGEYSTGMKKKIALCRAFLHNPKILFLDEPTSGLDPDAARNVNRLISTVARDEKITVFLCTHQLKYAEEICTLYGFIDNGKMLGFGTFSELIKNKNCSVTLEIRGKDIYPELGFENKAENIYSKPVISDKEAAELIKKIINSDAWLAHSAGEGGLRRSTSRQLRPHVYPGRGPDPGDRCRPARTDLAQRPQHRRIRGHRPEHRTLCA
jgi:ABC-2 type transport system ATP-binding protein